MQIARTLQELALLRKALDLKDVKIGFVPTMGALHQGHISLVNTAKQHSEFVIASIFVNPTQFGPGEDFNRYPRLPDQDAAMLQDAGTDLLFMPDSSEMYPVPSRFTITPGKSANVLCGKSRPGHFAGVGLVVTKLLNLVRPHSVFLGQKDLQQTVIIKQLVSDLNLSGNVIVCPTLREADGLAMSSRNRYLDPEERMAALGLYHTLIEAKVQKFEGMETRLLLKIIQKFSAQFERLQWEYIEIVNSTDLETPEFLDPEKQPAIVLAAKVGNTRLIDNMFLFD